METFYLDMDGVLCDLVGDICVHYGRARCLRDAVCHYGGVPDVLPEWAPRGNAELWREISKWSAAQFAQVAPLGVPGRLVADLATMGRVRVVSLALSKAHEQGKRMWLDRHIGHLVARDAVILRYPADKAQWARDNGACGTLIDDRPAGVAAWDVGPAVLWPAPWNSAPRVNLRELG